MQAMEKQAIRQCFQLLIFKPISTVTQGKYTTFHLTQPRWTRTFETIILSIASIVFCVDTTSWIAARKIHCISIRKFILLFTLPSKGAGRGEAYHSILPDHCPFFGVLCRFAPARALGFGRIGQWPMGDYCR